MWASRWSEYVASRFSKCASFKRIPFTADNNVPHAHVGSLASVRKFSQRILPQGQLSNQCNFFKGILIVDLDQTRSLKGLQSFVHGLDVEAAGLVQFRKVNRVWPPVFILILISALSLICQLDDARQQ